MNYLIFLVLWLSWIPAQVAMAAQPSAAADRFGFMLDIYGNADMNWTIDSADINYVYAVIKGTAPVTPYADANRDGVVDKNDLASIQALMDGTARSISLVDRSGATVTIRLPVTRLVTLAPWGTRTLVQLGVQDIIAGIDAYTAKGSKYAGQFAFLKACPKLSDRINVGTSGAPNKEVLAALHPDLILAGQVKADQAEVLETASGAPVFQPRDNLNGRDYAIENGPYENWLTLGYIFGKQDRALNIINFCENEFGMLKSRISALSKAEKRSAWYCSGKINRGARIYSPILLAGGTMPSAANAPFFGEIQLEQVLKWDPDVIFIQYWPHLAGMIDEIKKDPTLSLLKAIKTGQAVFLRNGRIGYDSAFSAAETWYIAKILYPEQFRNIDVEKKANHMLEFFYGTPGLYTWEITNHPVFRTWQGDD